MMTGTVVSTQKTFRGKNLLTGIGWIGNIQGLPLNINVPPD